MWRWTTESTPDVQSPNHWSSEGVVHEYGEHARHMLHAQGRFELQLGPQKNLRPQVQKKKKVESSMLDGWWRALAKGTRYLHESSDTTVEFQKVALLH